MEKHPFLNLLKNKKLLASLAGLAIAGIHLTAVSMLRPLSLPAYPFSPFSVRFLLQIALIAPGAMLLAIISLLPSQLTPHVFISDSLIAVLIYVSSSFFYGITGGVLVAKRNISRRVGFILVVWLILSNCAMWFFLSLASGAIWTFDN
jgi:hypothetical protein